MNIAENVYKIGSQEFGDKLFSSCREGDIHFIKAFLKSKISVEYSSISSVRQMINESAMKGHLNIVKEIFSDKKLKTISHKSFIIEDCFRIACDEGKLDLLNYINDSFSIDWKNYSNKHISLAIVRKGHINLLKQLVENFNINELRNNTFDGTERELLYAACEYGQLEIMKYLVEINSNDSDYLHKDNDYVLRIAHTNKYIEILNYLIFDLNIEKTKEITNHLENTPRYITENLFSYRELQKNLNINKEIKKNKI